MTALATRKDKAICILLQRLSNRPKHSKSHLRKVRRAQRAAVPPSSASVPAPTAGARGALGGGLRNDLALAYLNLGGARKLAGDPAGAVADWGAGASLLAELIPVASPRSPQVEPSRGLDHNPGKSANCEFCGPHSGPYGPAPVGSAVRTSDLPSSKVAGVMIKAAARLEALRSVVPDN